ncbi:MAG: hypothetical protein MUC50_23500 [Myxococcota bacterium]|jgi:hypothetical protein|nr:hypothetical protein [Myxococcota bacterium]
MSLSERISKAAMAALIGCLLTPLSANAQVFTPAVHLTFAEDLIDTIAPYDNVHSSSPTFVYWEGVDGHTKSENRSKCSTFLSRLFMESYSLSWTDMTNTMGCSSPNAAQYYSLIVSGTGPFLQLTNIADVVPGDIIAVRYDNSGCQNITCSSFTDCSSSGHVMLVSSVPISRTATKPLIADTEQYAVSVIDSSSSCHGNEDTRRGAEDGLDDTGVGEGALRLFANASGEIVGYSWSLLTGSQFYDAQSRPLAIGRYLSE